MAHDSYHCGRYESFSFPFPTRRDDRRGFVGMIGKASQNAELPACPESCRPQHHPDWTYC